MSIIGGSRIFRIHPLCDFARVPHSRGTFNGGLESLLPELPARICCCLDVPVSSCSRRPTKSDTRGLARGFNRGCGSPRVAFWSRLASRSCCMILRSSVSVSFSKFALLLPEPSVSSSCACTFCIVVVTCMDSACVAARFTRGAVRPSDW
jgi:hypothetical protein